MARINLLPWRQEERERKNKEFNVVAAAAAALAILAVLATMMFLNGQLSNQQAANDLIRNENTRLDGVNKEIEGLEQQRDEMISRMKIIQDLQGQRSIPVRVWDDIARAIPQSMYLVNMKREGNTITLTGFADNPNVVSQLIRNLDASPWLDNSGVPNIKTEAQAYQSLTSKAAANATAQSRPVYPEDNYIAFTVTTQVKLDEKVISEISPDGVSNSNVGNEANQLQQPATDQQALTTPPLTSPEQVAQPQVVDVNNPNAVNNTGQVTATPATPSAPVSQQPVAASTPPASQSSANEQSQGQTPPVAPPPTGSQVGGQ